MKDLYLIRHGNAQHNKLFDEIGVDAFYDPNYQDTILTKKGYDESIHLKSIWGEINNIELVLTSSLTRCIETSLNIFSDTDIPIIALETIKEYPQGLHYCNKRSNINILKKKFPRVDFSNIQTDEDTLWDPENKESIEQLNKRIEDLKVFLKGRKENNIAIVSHSCFLEQFKDNKISLIENGEKELLHCIPYFMRLQF